MVKFSGGEIRRSLQRFRDYSSDFINSDFNTFDDRFNLFISFCKSDKVFSVIHNQLISLPEKDFDEWYKNVSSSGGSVVGSGRLVFPVTIDDRISIMYRLLLKIHSGEIRVHGFWLKFFAVSSTRIEDQIFAFSDAVIQPLVRELEYKLVEIEENLPEDNKEQVSSSIIQVINAGNNFTQQIMQGNQNSQSVVQNKIDPKIKNYLEQILRLVENSNIGNSEKEDATETINYIEQELLKSNPNKKIIEKLFSTLPKIANIASIVGFIIALL